MQIYGFQKTTLLDYPEHVAASIFTGGCNFRCPFCHNSGLVLDFLKEPVILEDEVLSYLKKRRGILDGVCVTGGEPTLQKDLKEFLGKIRELGYKIKLDTNGYRPKVLQELFQEKLIDYIAMDIKASRENYSLAAGIEKLDISLIEESIKAIQNSGVAYEFRTTVVKGIHKIEEFAEIGKWLKGSDVLYLQQFRESEHIIGEGFLAFSKEEMEEMVLLASKHLDKVVLRGVE